MLRKNPDRWIESTDVVGTGDEKLELTAVCLVPIAYPPTGMAFDPLDDSAAIHTLDFAE